MQACWPLLLLFGFVLVILCAGLLAAKETWTVLAEGALKRIECRETKHSRRTGTMVHRARHYTIRRNTIFFEGGTVIYGITGILKEPGTVLVRLMQSNRGRYRLESYASERAI